MNNQTRFAHTLLSQSVYLCIGILENMNERNGELGMEGTSRQGGLELQTAQRRPHKESPSTMILLVPKETNL